MRQYNADPLHEDKIRFYGFDSPTEMMGTDSPSHVLRFVLDYLTSIDGDTVQVRRERIDALLGSDADWENPAAMMDPTQSVGLSAAAVALRIETEDLITELERRRPDLIAESSRDHYWEALQHAVIARQLLNYHAGLARTSAQRVAELLGIRDAMMADILASIEFRERDRGKVLVFAHNRHLQYGRIEWQLGPHHNLWWPAGAHLREMFGSRYAVIGSGVVVSEANDIHPPEPRTLEALLMSSTGSGQFILTHNGRGLPVTGIAALPTRSGSMKNSTYMPLNSESFTDFDGLLVLRSTSYSRGGPALP
jgi:erythromycin esterase-like protein